jgi:hypothetical protein
MEKGSVGETKKCVDTKNSIPVLTSKILPNIFSHIYGVNASISRHCVEGVQSEKK